MRTQRVKVSDIHVGARKRTAINPETVRTIAASIKEIGLQNPISICFRDNIEIDGELVDGVGCLVAGAHRREALISLGPKFEYVDAVVFDDEIAARKWEISENLHRAELSVLERSEHIAEWIELTERKLREDRETNKLTNCESIRKRGQPQGGVEAAERELGLKRMEGRRAVDVSSLPPEAKQAARDTGLDDHQSALLAAAKEMKTHGPEAAVAKINEIAAKKSAPKPPKETVTADRALDIMAADIIASHKPASIASPLIETIRAAEDDAVSGARTALDEFLGRFACLTADQRRECLAGRDLAEVFDAYTK